LIVVGSVAAGTDTVFSDLDLIVVAREDQRDGLWAEREHVAETLLGQRLGWSQDLPWQGPFRFQASRQWWI
jgi:predicted nucleotidyltransferase